MHVVRLLFGFILWCWTSKVDTHVQRLSVKLLIQLTKYCNYFNVCKVKSERKKFFFLSLANTLLDIIEITYKKCLKIPCVKLSNTKDKDIHNFLQKHCMNCKRLFCKIIKTKKMVFKRFLNIRTIQISFKHWRCSKQFLRIILLIK